MNYVEKIIFGTAYYISFQAVVSLPSERTLSKKGSTEK
jgi:hypothetical protein